MTCFIIDGYVDSVFVLSGCVACFNLATRQTVFTAPYGLKCGMLFTSTFNFIPSMPHTLLHLHHGRPTILWQAVTSVIVGWFAGRTWKINTVWCTHLPRWCGFL